MSSQYALANGNESPICTRNMYVPERHPVLVVELEPSTMLGLQQSLHRRPRRPAGLPEGAVKLPLPWRLMQRCPLSPASSSVDVQATTNHQTTILLEKQAFLSLYH